MVNQLSVAMPGSTTVAVRGYLELPRIADTFASVPYSEKLARTMRVTALGSSMFVAIDCVGVLCRMLGMASSIQLLTSAIEMGTVLYVAALYLRGKASIGEILDAGLWSLLFRLSVVCPLLLIGIHIHIAFMGAGILILAVTVVPVAFAAWCLRVAKRRDSRVEWVQQQAPNFRSADPWWRASMKEASKNLEEIVYYRSEELVKWVTDPNRFVGDGEEFFREGFREAKKRLMRVPIGEWDTMAAAGRDPEVEHLIRQSPATQQVGRRSLLAFDLWKARRTSHYMMDRLRGRYETLIGSLMEYAGGIEPGPKREAFVTLGYQLVVDFSRLRHIWQVGWDPAAIESKALDSREHDQMWLLIKEIRAFRDPAASFGREQEESIVDSGQQPEIAKAMRSLLRTVLKTLSWDDFDAICLQRNDKVAALRKYQQARAERAVDIVMRALKANCHLLPGMAEQMEAGLDVGPQNRSPLEEALKPCLRKYAESLVSVGLFDELDALTAVAVGLQERHFEQLDAKGLEYNPFFYPHPLPLLAISSIVRRQTENQIFDAEGALPDADATVDEEWSERAQREASNPANAGLPVGWPAFYITA